MSIYIWIALGVIAGFVLGWNVGMHLPYYYRPIARLRKIKLSPKLKKYKRRGVR